MKLTSIVYWGTGLQKIGGGATEVRCMVKVTPRSADSPRRPLSGHLADTHISLGTFQGHSHYSLVTLFVHMGTCNSHMSPSWGTCSATCPVNVRIWTSKCSRGSCYKALGFFFLFHNCFTLLVHLCFSCLAPHTFSFPTWDIFCSVS